MITNVTATANYDNYNLGFKGVKDKFKSIVANCATKITPKNVVVSPFTEEESKKLAQQHSSCRELIMAFESKATVTGLANPYKLRRLLYDYGYGEKFNELRKKMAFANDKESAVIKQEMRDLLDECASKYKSFEVLIKSFDNFKYRKEGSDMTKIDVLDLFLRE